MALENLVTAEEAAALACVREPNGENKDGAPMFPCRGPACMAWRWHVVRLNKHQEFLPHELERLGPEWEKDELSTTTIINRKRGYCGLAGHPGALR